MPTYVTAKTEVLATHKWPNTPIHRKYLSLLHAHKFLFEVHALVSHDDRDIEFHDLYEWLNQVIANMVHYKSNGPPTFGDMSCEQIGRKILEGMPSVSFVVVSEDGQFSAKVFREDDRLPGKRIYLASSSRGNRDRLKAFADALVRRGYFVFSPCLGFIGVETPEVRPLLLKISMETLLEWANVLIFFDEDIPSEGGEAEIKAANLAGIPTTRAKDSSDLEDLEEIMDAIRLE